MEKCRDDPTSFADGTCKNKQEAESFKKRCKFGIYPTYNAAYLQCGFFDKSDRVKNRFGQWKGSQWTLLRDHQPPLL
jgi:hypothetical protein